MEIMKKTLLAVIAALSLGTAVAHEGCEQAPVDAPVEKIEAPVVEEAITEEVAAPTIEEEVAQNPVDIASIEEEQEEVASDDVEQALNDMAK